MDENAITKIQDSANIQNIIDQLQDFITETPIVAIPKSMEIKSIERYMEHPSRYRMKYETNSIDDFVTYNKKFDQEGAHCFIDAAKMNALSIFDLGTTTMPLHKENTASIKLNATAAYLAILHANGKRLSQREAAEFIEDWADHITVTKSDSETMTPKDAAAALRNLTIEAARETNNKVNDFGESMSQMEKIEAKGQAQIPASILFRCIPYQNIPEQSFTLRVSILTSSDKPAISLRIIQLEAIKEEMANKFKDILSSEFSELKMDTFIGGA